MKTWRTIAWSVLKSIFLYSPLLITGCGDDRVSIARLPGGLRLVQIEGVFGTIEQQGETFYPLDAKNGGTPFSWECNEVFPVREYIVGKCIKPKTDSNPLLTKYFVIDARDRALLSSEDPADYLHEFTTLQDLELYCRQVEIVVPDALYQ